MFSLFISTKLIYRYHEYVDNIQICSFVLCISDSMELWLCNYVVRSFDFNIYRLESYNDSLQFILFLIYTITSEVEIF